MRLGLIGLGRIGSFHAETLSALPDVDLVVCDAFPALAKAAAERFGAEAVDTPAALLAAGIDGVVIAAATDAHPALLTAAVDAGLPVFCEKPLARTADEAKRVRDYVLAARATVQIGYPRRFDPAFTAARAALAAGELGWLHTVRSTTLDPAPPPREYVAVSGGIFRDCSVHDFDAVRWVTAQEVREVYAAGSNQGEEFFGEYGDVDTAAVVLTLTDGTLALVSNSRYNGRGYDVRLELHGSADSIAVGLDDRLPLRSAEPGAMFPAGPPHVLFMDRLAVAFRAELGAFTDVVAGRSASPCTVDDALEASLIAEACVLSLSLRRPVAMTEIRPAAR
ncbi:MAG: Gfo/Idh/MocA family oxidoreductase [Pseudonocardiales bacterium]